jgi:metal-sulfur cluster biosynthetic enzyme
MDGLHGSDVAWCVECRSSSFAIEEVNVATEVLNEEIARSALRQVKDPELEMNIVELGLVYDVEIEDGSVRVRMTLTSPGCPAGPMITNDAYRVLRALDGVKDVNIDIVWEPYWTPERIDPKVRALLGL